MRITIINRDGNHFHEAIHIESEGPVFTVYTGSYHTEYNLEQIAQIYINRKDQQVFKTILGSSGLVRYYDDL